MSDVVKRLRYLTSASAEAMSDYERINAFVNAGADACAEIERLQGRLNESNAAARAFLRELGNRASELRDEFTVKQGLSHDQ